MTPLSDLATAGTPFFFITDFSGKSVQAFPMHKLNDAGIFFDFSDAKPNKHNHKLKILQNDFQSYKKGFDTIIEAIKRGETYVLNYTQKTEVSTPLTLKEIYNAANAKYKLLFKDQFVCFSPETFVTIENDIIHTFPMKGTIDANLPDAQATILSDPKELAEHIMIVDLLRNDLGMVATDISVESFRYIDKINAGNTELLQVSSHIQGKLPSNWKDHLDEIIAKLLPAGSISGTPKKSSVKQIVEIENFERGYYTGIMGFFDGNRLTTAVMIRFLEQENGKLFYKSGGGITLDSDARKEYQELRDKIYIP